MRATTEPLLVGDEIARLEPDFSLASFAQCRARGCVIARRGDTVFLVCREGLGLQARQWFEPLIERMGPQRLIRAAAAPQDFAHLLAGAQESLRAMGPLARDEAGGPTPEADPAFVPSSASIEAAGNAPMELVDSTLHDALELGASDIHLEVHQNALQIRYRIDGVLQAIRRIDDLQIARQVISRIKVLAELDIAERRVPRDGRFRVLLHECEIEFHVSFMPKVSDEDVVLHVLGRRQLTGPSQSLTLDTLRLDADVTAFVRRGSRQPHGLLLVTGPMGSGKTTTLYAAISEINTGLDKIISIEDPIEYPLPGVLQIPVDEKKGLTFARGLRSILRHDPDKIMVGEIRDSETAQTAVQAALTGHQVFTTVHANNVFDVIGRFTNMGVDRYSLAGALNGIVAQRLVRTLCTRCTQPLPGGRMKPVGCASCRGTGYSGRVAVAETLALDDGMKDLLVQHAPVSAVKRHARERGFRSMREAAEALVESGLTSTEEADRVTAPD